LGGGASLRLIARSSAIAGKKPWRRGVRAVVRLDCPSDRPIDGSPNGAVTLDLDASDIDDLERVAHANLNGRFR
jgi:hypothetical protein